MKKVSFIISLFLFINISAFSQDLSGIFDDDDTKENYFSSKNLIKLNLIPLFQGEVSITYERCFGKHLSAEAGIGIQLPYIIPDYTMYHEDYTDFRDPDLSFHYWISSKVYLFGEAPEGMFLGLQFRKKNYNLWPETYISPTLPYYGWQNFISDHLMMETNIGYGLRETDDEVNDILETYVTIALAIKIAYSF